jgi:hypothetical protein
MPKTEGADEPEGKPIHHPSAEATMPGADKKRKATDDDEEYVAAKRSKTESAAENSTAHAAHKESGTADLAPARVPNCYLSAQPNASGNSSMVEATASIFGDPRSSASLKRKADDDIEGEVAFTKRVRIADNEGDTDAAMTALVPAAAHPIPVHPSVEPKDIFPFLLLPAEIRLQIYALLFKLRRPVYPRVGIAAADNGTRSGFRKGLVLAMVLANRKLSREVTHFIYSNNCFRLTLRWHRDWVSRIGRKNSSLIQDVILVGSGRPKLATEYLYSTVVTLWKRACANLRRITVQDDWRCMDSSFVVQQLVEFGKKRGWKRFNHLEHIGIDIPHTFAPHGDRALYDKLVQQSKVSLTARHQVDSWDQPLQLTESGWRANGLVWLNVVVAKTKKKPAIDEEKKRAALLRKEEKRKARLVIKAKAWVEAEFAKSQEQDMENGQQEGGEQGSSTSA